MFGNLSASFNDSIINYPISDSTLPFSEYILRCQQMIQDRRMDLHHPGVDAARIIETNSPYELLPQQPMMAGKRIKYGVLLIHGLLDCPFSLRDTGNYLQSKGMLCRSILLPGHGTNPADLLNISYHTWIQAVRYGIETLKQEVEQIYLVGYSTGATLSVYHALQDSQINGIVLLAPAIRIKAPVNIIAGWQYLMRWLSENRQWMYRQEEVDYTKYLSIGFNPVNQVAQLTDVIKELREQHQLECPVFMALSREDETISSDNAIDFFSSLPNQESKLLLYTSFAHRYPDRRIITRETVNPELQIKHFSHVSIPFAPDNPHYGKNGDYAFASHMNTKDFIYGAYNHVEERFFNLLYQLQLIKCRRRELTFNPDFDFMAENINKFIQG